MIAVVVKVVPKRSIFVANKENVLHTLRLQREWK